MTLASERVEHDRAAAGGNARIEVPHPGGKSAALSQNLRIARRDRQRPRVRFARLREAVTLIRALWTQERVSFEGQYYKTEKATIYDRPDTPVPIYVAAAGALVARYAGRSILRSAS